LPGAPPPCRGPRAKNSPAGKKPSEVEEPNCVVIATPRPQRSWTTARAPFIHLPPPSPFFSSPFCPLPPPTDQIKSGLLRRSPGANPFQLTCRPARNHHTARAPAARRPQQVGDLGHLHLQILRFPTSRTPWNLVRFEPPVQTVSFETLGRKTSTEGGIHPVRACNGTGSQVDCWGPPGSRPAPPFALPVRRPRAPYFCPPLQSIKAPAPPPPPPHRRQKKHAGGPPRLFGFSRTGKPPVLRPQ